MTYPLDRPLPWHAGLSNGIPPDVPEPSEEEQEMDDWFEAVFACEPDQEEE